VETEVRAIDLRKGRFHARSDSGRVAVHADLMCGTLANPEQRPNHAKWRSQVEYDEKCHFDDKRHDVERGTSAD